MWVLQNPSGIPIGQFSWLGEALERQKSRKGYKIIKKEFVDGRWQVVSNPQLTL